MSYITKRGAEAAKSATAEKQETSKLLAKFGSGTTYKVRVPGPNESVEYMAASAYKVFTTTPVDPKDNLYAKAADLLYKDANKAKDSGDEATAEELRTQARSLKPSQRFMFGFYDLATGDPIIIDVTRNQAKAIQSAIDKFAKRLGKVAFELSKSGSGTSTTVSLTPILDMDEDITDQERANFEKTAAAEFPDAYGEIFAIKTQDEQAADLTAYGFDVARLGINATTAQAGANDGSEPLDIDDEDLPF